MLKLSSYNAKIMFVMTRPTKGNPIINVYSKFREVFVRLYMMSSKVARSTTVSAFVVVSAKNFSSPIFVSPSMSPLSTIDRHSFNALLAFSSNYLRVSSLIRASLRAESSFAFKIRELVKSFTAPFALLVYSVFGHQSEYNKIIGVNQ